MGHYISLPVSLVIVTQVNRSIVPNLDVPNAPTSECPRVYSRLLEVDMEPSITTVSHIPDPDEVEYRPVPVSSLDDKQ